MRSFRNPRYAPESLERKLNPSGISPIPVAAEMYVPAATKADVTPVAPLDGVASARGGPAAPGDPIPTGPTAPTYPDGTGPAPPPGNGTPPSDSPSIPSGPGEPGVTTP